MKAMPRRRSAPPTATPIMAPNGNEDLDFVEMVGEVVALEVGVTKAEDATKLSIA